MSSENTSRDLTVLLVYGSVRSERNGIRLVKFLAQRVKAAGYRALIVDPLELDLPLLDKMYKEYDPGQAPSVLQNVADMIAPSDAVIVVSAEYNHSMPPALKNLLDHFLEEWFHRPSGIACYSGGRFGGVRAAMQLRATLPELGMPTISSLLPVPVVQNAVSEEGTDNTDWLTDAADAFISELAWWARAAKAQRAEHGTPF